MALPKPEQQAEIIEPNPDVGLAGPRPPRSEGEGNLAHRTHVAAHQDFQQDLESPIVQFDVFQARPANHEESSHRVLYLNVPLLYGISQPDRHLRKQMPSGVPVIQTTLRSVATRKHDVSPAIHRFPQSRQQFGWMLQVGIDHPQNFGVGVLPSIEHGATQAAFALSHQQPHTRIFLEISCTIESIPSPLSSSTTRIS